MPVVLSVESAIDAVMVYPDGALVTRVIAVDLPAGDSRVLVEDFPPELDTASLRVDGEAEEKLMIEAVDARPPRPVPPAKLPEIDQRIEVLKDERADLQDAIAAAEARRKFAERFAEKSPAGLGEQGEARPLAEWRAAFAAVSEEVADARAAIRAAERRQRELDREIARLEADRAAEPPNRLGLRIDVSAAAATRAVLRVSYAMRDACWAPLYDARLDTGSGDRKPALELIRRAEITQSTGEDWSDVTLSLATARVARRSEVPDLDPLIVEFEAAEFAVVRRRFEPAGAASAPAPKKAEEQQAVQETSAFQATFRIPGRVSISASEGGRGLRISTVSIAPELVIRSTPLLDPTAFLEASFVHGEDAPLLSGRVAIYRDGMFVGRVQMTGAGKGETVRLGFGADDQVKVERVVVKRSEGSSGLIVTTSKTDERSFKIIVHNGHDFPIQMMILDQMPVSEHEDIVVELLPSKTPPTASNVRDKRGVLEWAFEARPGEFKEIAFGWRMRWPKDRGVVMPPSG
ncbi:MAG: mucoidy inhibitor MuiA family protein [Bradyrhizobium sp.]|uniref:mucoidy inhibitor MuiA family protein n=1 Tax=Bradyrhizobium sp. TaxID=376 RepID=UPI001DF38C95|nr:mucoidy inhibitor MuiA family protein [Bradyrhizobium sp.]MBV9564608.1 mucoidy inhibitor MuiA family protein [Bradyrhizobium sp.]